MPGERRVAVRVGVDRLDAPLRSIPTAPPPTPFMVKIRRIPVRTTTDYSAFEPLRSWQELESSGLFVVDVTQPMGLGTKLAPTFVTRTLVGENGITYKYLGLRMFAHPWNPGHAHVRCFPGLQPKPQDGQGGGAARASSPSATSSSFPPPLATTAALESALISVCRATTITQNSHLASNSINSR